MSTFNSDDLGTKGYFLPEDSQLRLKQLREYVGFLTHLARPRRPDEDQEWYSEIRPGEVAICMELLEEQIAQVLGELSWPAERGEREAVPEAEAERDSEPEGLAAAEAVQTADTEPAFAGPARNEAGKRYVAGVTLYQIDEINLLLDSLHAIGNVVACTDQAEFSDATLSTMGDAIYRDVDALRDIIHAFDSMPMQRLDEPHGTKPGVREEHASYLALPLHVPMGTASPIVRQLLTCH